MAVFLNVQRRRYTYTRGPGDGPRGNVMVLSLAALPPLCRRSPQQRRSTYARPIQAAKRLRRCCRSPQQTRPIDMKHIKTPTRQNKNARKTQGRIIPTPSTILWPPLPTNVRIPVPLNTQKHPCTHAKSKTTKQPQQPQNARPHAHAWHTPDFTHRTHRRHNQAGHMHMIPRRHRSQCRPPIGPAWGHPRSF